MPAPKKPASPKATQYATRATIRKAASIKLPEKDVPVPEWGGTIRVRGLTVKAQDALIAEAGGDENKIEDLYMAKCIVKPADLTFEDIMALKDGSADPWNRVVLAINNVNGEGDSSPAKAEAKFPPDES